MARRRKDDDIAFDLAKLVGVVLVGAMFIPGFAHLVYGFGALLLITTGVVLVGLFAYRTYQRRNRVVPVPAAAPPTDRFSEPKPFTPAFTIPLAPNSKPVAASLADQIRSIDWFQFEKLVAAVYRKLGYAVTQRGGANPDGGIDLIIEKDGSRTAIQCKHWKSRQVGVRAVRELLGAMTHERISEGELLTISGYTQEAKALADPHQITILTEREMVALLESTDASYDPKILAILNDTTKYCPKCGAVMEIKTARKGPGAGEKFWGCSTFPRCWQKMPIESSQT